MTRAHLHCFMNRLWARRKGIIWSGHCWDLNGVCADCGKRGT